MDKNAIYKLSYGLFVLTVRDEDKDTGCIINSAMQVAVSPDRICISVNKTGFTHDVLTKTDQYILSVISQEASMELFENFGFQSGRDADKFANFADCKRAANGILYITKGTNAYISVKITKRVDIGTHTMFIGEITDMEVLSDAPSATYDYYQKEIKPAPTEAGTTSDGQTIWRCEVCGYEYVGDIIPSEFVCPTCNNNAGSFKKVE